MSKVVAWKGRQLHQWCGKLLRAKSGGISSSSFLCDSLPDHTSSSPLHRRQHFVRLYEPARHRSARDQTNQIHANTKDRPRIPKRVKKG